MWDKRTWNRSERTNERTLLLLLLFIYFINEGNGISAILFYIQPSGKKQNNNNNNNTTTKTIKNKIIINSKRTKQTVVFYICLSLTPSLALSSVQTSTGKQKRKSVVRDSRDTRLRRAADRGTSSTKPETPGQESANQHMCLHQFWQQTASRLWFWWSGHLPYSWPKL